MEQTNYGRDHLNELFYDFSWYVAHANTSRCQELDSGCEGEKFEDFCKLLEEGYQITFLGPSSYLESDFEKINELDYVINQTPLLRLNCDGEPKRHNSPEDTIEDKLVNEGEQAFVSSNSEVYHQIEKYLDSKDIEYSLIEVEDVRHPTISIFKVSNQTTSTD
jgi:hypothetical protein